MAFLCVLLYYVCTISSAQYRVAKYLDVLLKRFALSSRQCKDSFAFVDSLKSLDLNSNDYIICSFDVVSLFTNIPTLEVIDICSDLWEALDDEVDITTVALKKLLNFACCNVPFIHKDSWYAQVDGVSMGSPLAPTLASIFLNSLEKNLDILTNGVVDVPVFYTRYVDDVFLIFDKCSNVSTFLDFCISLHPNIKFTMELEKDAKIIVLKLVFIANLLILVFTYQIIVIVIIDIRLT